MEAGANAGGWGIEISVVISLLLMKRRREYVHGFVVGQKQPEFVVNMANIHYLDNTKKNRSKACTNLLYVLSFVLAFQAETGSSQGP